MSSFKLGFTVALLLFLLPITECLETSEDSRVVEKEISTREEKVGSRPPKCSVEKCLNCRPCMATLVAPSHQTNYPSASTYENYYLLAWKCKCGNKVFPP